jgi:hypothetical protein
MDAYFGAALNSHAFLGGTFLSDASSFTGTKKNGNLGNWNVAKVGRMDRYVGRRLYVEPCLLLRILIYSLLLLSFLLIRMFQNAFLFQGNLSGWDTRR